MMKKVLFAIVLASAIALVVPTLASANFGIHGNYLTDTDACAGCHRAHTSVSTITWTDTNGDQQSALLTTAATKMSDFCLTCHDATSQGADTNVVEGIYEGTEYGSQFGTLNGGGIETVDGAPITSTHTYDGAKWGAYGGGYFGDRDLAAFGPPLGQNPDANIGESDPMVMDCATCHDPHGSANYRILKSVVYGNNVGGYIPYDDPTNPNPWPGPNPEYYPTPDGWVQSVEPGWPTGGFQLHTEYPDYTPNYTTAMYAKGYDMADGDTINAAKGMSGWCAGCHQTYLGPKTEFTKSDGTTYTAFASLYNSGDGLGLALRHRHPINVELDAYTGPDKANMIIADQVLPLSHDLAEKGTPSNEATDWIECLTCHRAHGTSVTMTGWADELADDPNDEIPSFIAQSGTGEPSALLRLENRGVCEVCHNK